ncbi:MAG: hypothetical protein BWY75_03772 [bacterium ADurb.Bin425]|nr:MAG: hypothetical protein BWY75_03772 [bacterium ADurb.Bin425]
MKKTVLALILISMVQAAFANEPAKSMLVEPEAFSKLVAQRKYKEAHDTAVAESKLVAEELEYVRGNKLVPYDKRYIYLRRPFEYYEVLLATKEDALAESIEQEVFRTLPEKSCFDYMLEVSKRAGNSAAAKRLAILKGKCKR